MVTSKFKTGVLVSILVSLFLLVILILAIIAINPSPLVLGITLPLCFLLLFWLSWFELRTKAWQLTIEVDRISGRNFFGRGSVREWRFSEIVGYKITSRSSEYNTYEYLYLFCESKKVAALSEFYHENYSDVKKAIAKNCKRL